jgi:hypothetical protein
MACRRVSTVTTLAGKVPTAGGGGAHAMKMLLGDGTHVTR